MAKTTKKKPSSAGPRIWQAEPDDAIRLAALRWFAISIERLSIEIYASDKQQYEPIEDLLRHTLKRMEKIGKRADVREDEECPNGYVLCRDGLCAPMCEGEALDSDS